MDPARIQDYPDFGELVRAQLYPGQYGFDEWTVVKATHLAAKNTALVTLANPLQRSLKQVAVKDATEKDVHTFVGSYREHYLEQLESRFGFFLPDLRTGDVEYEDFSLFKDFWITTEDGKSVLPYNIPLLFDFAGDLEYEEAKQDGTFGVNYQRLVIIVAQPRMRRLKTLFIKNVDEQQFEQIKSEYSDAIQTAAKEMF